MSSYSTHVDYSQLDPIKQKILQKVATTFSHPERFGIRYMRESLGEAAAVFDFLDQDFMIAFILETLGTKVLVADNIRGKTEIARQFEGKPLYAGIGQDLIAMVVCDLNNVGAQPVALGDVIASGDTSYFTQDSDRTEQLLEGLVKGANISKATLAAGDTPNLEGIVNPMTLDMTAGGFGLLRPKTRFTEGGRKIQVGDVIYGFPSSGMHSNGYSLAIAIVEQQPESYATKLPNGKMIGEELLRPTQIYSDLLEELFDSGVEIHYISHITGHGWKKVARAKQDLNYVIENLPEPQQEFQFLMENGSVSLREAYQTWNMGIGVVIMAPHNQSSQIKQIGDKYSLPCTELGYVIRGGRQKRHVLMPLKEDGKFVVYAP